MYKFTKYAKENPIRFQFEGGWVAIGKEITLERKPPRKNEVIKVATQKQLEKLISKYPKYIEYVKDAESSKSDAVERERLSGGQDAV